MVVTWKTNIKFGDEEAAEQCRQELLKQLKGLELNEYKYESMKESLEKKDKIVHAIL